MLTRFLNFVEIKTKITSVFAFSMALAWLFCKEQPVLWGRTALFFAAMFLFDLTTTAINNYVDTKTNGQTLPFKRSVALTIILILFFMSACLGLLVAFMTDVVVLLLGGICFLCGVSYTFGPLPISRMPLGELVSGAFYGLLIPFLVLYINMPEGTYLALSLTWQTISASLELRPSLEMLLLMTAPACATANIMLANNICDVERDILVKRYTLPYYLGRKNALVLFTLLCYAPYAAALLMVLLGMLPWMYLLILLTWCPIQKNIGIFVKKQEKETTFICSIKNYVLLMCADVLLIFVSGFF